MSKNPTGISHENFQREKIRQGTNRNFGFVFTAFFAVLTGIAFWTDSKLLLIWLCAALGTLVITIFFPSWLGPFNKIWHEFGLLLSKITNPVVLGFLFFIIVTPTGILMRLFHRDPLRLRLDNESNSYWIPRNPPGPERGTMNKQF